jgi:hypothetical protein
MQEISRADAGTRTPDPFITSCPFAGHLAEIPAPKCSYMRLWPVRIAEFGTYSGTRLISSTAGWAVAEALLRSAGPESAHSSPTNSSATRGPS